MLLTTIWKKLDWNRIRCRAFCWDPQYLAGLYVVVQKKKIKKYYLGQREKTEIEIFFMKLTNMPAFISNLQSTFTYIMSYGPHDNYC